MRLKVGRSCSFRLADLQRALVAGFWGSKVPFLLAFGTVPTAAWATDGWKSDLQGSDGLRQCLRLGALPTLQ